VFRESFPKRENLHRELRRRRVYSKPVNDMPATATPRRWQTRATVVVLALSVVSTLLGLLRPGHYDATPEVTLLYRVQDATILLVGVPVLALGLWYATRGSLRGRVVWLGGLAYSTYMWASVGLQVPYNEFFLGYVALFSLSLFAFVGGVVTTDVGAVRRTLEGRVSTSLYGGALVLVAAGLGVLWLADIVPALLSGTTPRIVEEGGRGTLVTHLVDLGVVVPSLFVAGAWLRRGRTWGYLLGGVALVLGAVLASSISAMTLVLMAGEAITVSPVAAVFTFLPVLVSAVLAVRYVVSMGRGKPEEPARGPTETV
jgi:hypothetical protein